MVRSVDELVELRDMYDGKRCCLNGRPAVISSAEGGLARVSTLDGHSATFSWEAVDRIMTAKHKRERGEFSA